MKARCGVASHQSYKNYGARGITICSEWFHDYLPFHNWAMSNGYEDNLTIERKDNDKGYSPENCAWVLKGKQGRNRRSTKMTMAKAQRIREFYRAGIGSAELARTFDISASHARSIIRGIRWNPSL
jgi:hypothetical protein